ncbi:dihydrolipoyl dehydrogenase [Trichloromonas sp.]|uniref:dihydrolipoyl dehydrogenase n=1 Tax=Trichloromonas sp. TaxID=3069249 RepID=UPI002A3B7959|nr:dihydrolipoyl dehydrogenase [Trichloromonas sp.]
MKEYDLAVIGGGPGGYVAAIRGAQRGARVCLVEAEALGGTCLNRGCIPTKALYATARILRTLREAGNHGIRIAEPGFDFATAVRRKDQVVSQLVGGVAQLLKGHGVDLYSGRGFLEGPGRLGIHGQGAVGHLRARAVILATGGRPLVPEGFVPDGKNVLTSAEFLAIKDLPKSLLIVGGGYIGCEFAGIFSTFGVSVSLVEQLPVLLARSDRQAVREVEKFFMAAGVRLHLNTVVSGVESRSDGVHVRLANGETLQVEKILLSVGRCPNSEGLGIEELGVRLDRGAVVVDEGMCTNVDGIYAIGDLTGGRQLAHVASYQAEIAVENALGGQVRADYRVVPDIVFTDPEIAQVGLTEEQCREAGLDFQVGRFVYLASGMALCMGEPRGTVKILAEKDGGRILGVTVVGADASTLIAEASLAMSRKLSARELAAGIRAHPSLPEMIKEAAEDLCGLAVHRLGRAAARRKSSDV